MCSYAQTVVFVRRVLNLAISFEWHPNYKCNMREMLTILLRNQLSH